MRRLVILCALLAAGAASADDVVLVDDPPVLATLESSGLALADLVPRWDTVAAVLERDLAELERQDPRAGVGVARFAHRLFDARWLRAATSRFELVGLVNRIDRQPLVDPGHGCGDTRLVYRLGYRRDGVASRLPMTVNLDLRPDADCAATARRWRVPDGTRGAALAAHLLSAAGPLAPALRDRARVASLQVNLQAVRWPSAVRPDLAAHAEYLLRTFRPDAGGALRPAPLDNTPDVARLRRDPALRAELLAWIAANLPAIDAATAQLPAKFLAMKALSVSPRGLARRANRPFLQIFAPRDLAALELAALRTIPSPVAALRRLDDASCVGCHQGRSIAGFHFLGVDPPDTVPGNALAVPLSPHLAAELTRRAAITAAFADGRTPDLARPFSERGAGDPGETGAHCGRGDPAFAAWSCAAGHDCDVYDAPADDDAVGTCLPPVPRTGDPCEIGRVKPHADPHKDRIPRPTAARDCGDGARCNRNAVGFPGGMCTASCDAPGPDGVCGAIAALRPFNDCLARREPFPKCLAENGSPAGLRACDATRPCRDDYLCVRLDAAGSSGACIPPYFLFQMRVDGHP